MVQDSVHPQYESCAKPASELGETHPADDAELGFKSILPNQSSRSLRQLVVFLLLKCLSYSGIGGLGI